MPEEMWDDIVEKIEDFEQQHPEALDVGTDSFDDRRALRPDRVPTMTTTSSDPRSTHRHRGRWGPLPGVDGAFAVE